MEKKNLVKCQTAKLSLPKGSFLFKCSPTTVKVSTSSVCGCSPIAFNQGAWIVGSQIAGEYDKFKKIAWGEAGSKEILRSLLEEESTFISGIEKVITQIF
jgi:hypothetical protein